MAAGQAATEARKLDSRATMDGDSPVQVKILQVPVKCGPVAASAASKGDLVPAPLNKDASTVHAAGPQTSSAAVMVVAKVAAAAGVSTAGQPHIIRPVMSQVASSQGRTVVIAVPRAAGPPPVAVAARVAQSGSSPLPANLQIPPGMMLIRSDGGQLMLVSQQALAQAQQGPRAGGQAARVRPPQVPAAASTSEEKVTVIRMAAPSGFQPGPVQKSAVVKVIGVANQPAVVQTVGAAADRGGQPRLQPTIAETKTEPPPSFSQETLESVKKCKNFLVTLIKLASSDSKAANMANNVKGLVRSLLEGKLEAEEFTEELYKELKSTPQPCLVPFLRKSLPAVRQLTADPQLFIQQASSSTCSPTVKQSSMDPGQTSRTGSQLIQQPRGVTLRPGFAMVTQSRANVSRTSRPTSSPKHSLVQTGKHFTGAFSVRRPFTQDPPGSSTPAFKATSGSYKEDDDINDVASMAGVNLREENAKILTGMVGSVVQSCQDQPFLSPVPVLGRILRIGQVLGVTDVGPEVVALVSHATQECLRGLLERLSVMAEHRRASLKENFWHLKVTDVRAQLRFLEEVESLKKKRRDEEERDRLLHLAKSRSHAEDPQHQQLRQRAKELQQMEEAQLQQREANLTALAAIGPRRKRTPTPAQGPAPVLTRPGAHRATRLMLRDLLVCMEQDQFLRRSLTLYRAML